MNEILRAIALSCAAGLATAVVSKLWLKLTKAIVWGVIVAAISMAALTWLIQRPEKPIAVAIVTPEEGSAVGPTGTVRGKASDASARIVVLVHPTTTDMYWVQNAPTIDKAGQWETLCFFGTETVGIDERYEIIAAAVRRAPLQLVRPSGLPSRAGATLKELPRNLNVSNVVTVRRTR